MSAPLVAARRHTWHLQHFAAAQRPVFLDTEVDLSAVAAHRKAAADRGAKYFWVTYLVHAAGAVIAAHPEANSALRGRFRPRVQRYDGVDVKLALDKELAGQRVVLAGVLREVQRSSLDQVQSAVAHFRGLDADTAAEFAGVRALDRLPIPLGALAFRFGAGSLTRRRQLMGTVSVSSLGAGAVDAFHSVGGTTITLGAGRVVDRAVVRGGVVVAAPVQRIGLAFDHRVIDGALAAQILTELKALLEQGPAQ